MSRVFLRGVHPRTYIGMRRGRGREGRMSRAVISPLLSLFACVSLLRNPPVCAFDLRVILLVCPVWSVAPFGIF